MTDTTFVAASNSKVGPVSFVFGVADTSQTATLSTSSTQRGRLSRCFLVLPNWTNAVTATLAITDKDGYTLYSEAGLARNQTHDLRGLDSVVAEDVTLTLTLSGAPGAGGGTATAAFYISDSAQYETNVSGGELQSDIKKIAGVTPQLDDTDKLAISCWFKGTNAGDTAPEVESTGEVKTSLYADVGGTPTKVEEESTGELKVSLYADVSGTPTKIETEGTGELKNSLYANVGGTPTKVDMQASGELDVNVNMVAGVAQVLDNTSTPRVSAYGKGTNAGDTPVLLESDGKAKTSLYGYNAAAGDTAIEVESTGEAKSSVYVNNGGTPIKWLGDASGHGQVDIPAVQLDDTDKFAVSLYGKSVAAGDKEVLLDSDGHTQVDILSTPVQLDDTDKFAVSLYGKSVAAGDKEVLLDSDGHTQVDVLSTPVQLDDTDKFAVSLYGKSVAAGDKEVLVDSDGHLQIDALSAAVTGTVNIEVGGQAPQLDDTDKIAVSLYGKSVAAGDKEVLLDSDGHTQVDVLSTPVQLDDTDKFAVSLYGKSVAAGDKEVLVDSDGHVQCDLPAVQLDDTDKLAVSLYGKAVAAGDKEILVDSDGHVQVDVLSAAGTVNIEVGGQAPQLDDTDKIAVSLYGKSVAAGDKEILVDSDGHTQVDVLSTPVQLDDTDKFAVSLYGKAVAAGDKEVLVDSDGHVQVDVLSAAGTVNIEVGGQAPQLDDTDKMAVSLYGKSVAAGDKEVLLDSDGHVQIDALTLPAVTGTVNIEVGGQAPQLDDTDKIAVSLYGKSSNAGDMPILVDASGNVQCELPGVQLDDTDKLAVSLYGKASAAGDKEILVDSDGHIQADILSAPTIAIKSAPKIKTTQATIDLPANSSACAEIDTSGANTRELHIYVREEFRWCCAADGTAAATAIASDTSSAILPAGYWCFAVNNTYKFYLRSNDASALTDGVSYWLAEE